MHNTFPASRFPRRHHIRTLAAGCVLAVTLGAAATVAPVSRADSLQGAQAELDRLEGELQKTSAQLSAAQQKRRTLTVKIDASTKQLADTQARLDAARNELSQNARGLYKTGMQASVAQFATFLGKRSGDDASRANAYLQRVQNRTGELIRRVDAAKADLAAENKSLRDAKATNDKLIDVVDTNKDRIEAAVARQQELVAKYRSQLAAAAVARYSGGGGGPVAPPDNVRSYGNGRLPDSALESIGVGDHRLTHAAAQAFRAMFAAANAAGAGFGITDSYRSYAAQVDVARRKGLYGRGGLAAIPGTSNHGWGLALDLDLSAKASAWLHANAGRYGFVNDVPRENWHWTYHGR